MLYIRLYIVLNIPYYVVLYIIIINVGQGVPRASSPEMPRSFIADLRGLMNRIPGEHVHA